MAILSTVVANWVASLRAVLSLMASSTAIVARAVVAAAAEASTASVRVSSAFHFELAKRDRDDRCEVG